MGIYRGYTKPITPVLTETGFNWTPDPARGMTDWQLMEGGGSWAISPTGSYMGSYAMDFTGYQWWEYRHNIPYDHTALYSGTVTAVQNGAGTNGTAYFGFAGVAGDGVTYINNDGGANLYGSQHYFIAAGVVVVGENQFRGNWSGIAGSAPTALFPGVNAAYAGIRFIRPLMILQYNTGTATTRVENFTIRNTPTRLMDDTGWIEMTGFTNGWTPYQTGLGASWTPRYRRRNGLVHLQGLLTTPNPAVSSVAFTLPVGYRPGTGTTMQVVMAAGSAVTRMDVGPDGTINPQVEGITSLGWRSLACTFVAEN